MYTNTSRRRRGAPRPSGARTSDNRRNRPPSRGRSSSSRGKRAQPTFDPSQFINKNPIETAPDVYTPTHTFDTMGLSSKLAETIGSLGMHTPSPIQDQVITEILKGHDVIGLAQTGTGKTAAFLIPLIEKLTHDPKRQVLILAPTRELALQIEQELRSLARGMRVFSTVCVGGVNIRPQISGLKRPNHFIIGTPGRVLDLMRQGYFHPERMNAVVLDEADRMLDMGFINDMRTILSATPKDRETLFFSATMSPATDKLVNDFLRNPVRVSVKKNDVINTIEQDVVRYKHDAKFETLHTLLTLPEYKRVIVFGAMKHSVERLARELSAQGVKAESIHGNKSHSQRQRSLKNFKDGKAQVLVATDVAARGIHVENVSHVINYDLPGTFEDYVHRIGRTGRADKRGKALTFIQA